MWLFCLVSGYVYRRTRSAPKLSDYHQMQRYIWCQTHKNTDFSRHLYVDETTIRVLEIPLYHSRLVSSRPEAKASTGKIRLKVNIWGGISFVGPTDFVVSMK
jgi:hypothetical protein